MPDFLVQTAFRGSCRLSEIVQKKTLIWVLRYIGCPSCRYDVDELSSHAEAFAKKGVSLLVLMQSSVENIRKTYPGGLPFEILCDPDQEIYRSLSIDPAQSMEQLRPESEAGKERMAKKFNAIREMGITHGEYEGNEQQLPAFFILEKDLTVAHAHYAADLVDMPDVEEALAMICRPKRRSFFVFFTKVCYIIISIMPISILHFTKHRITVKILTSLREQHPT